MKRFFALATFVLMSLMFLIPVPADATTGYAATLRNSQLDAITTFIGNAGKLDIYDGTRPSTCAAITTQNKLAEFTLGSPFAPPASSATLSPTLPSATTGITSGTASWWRIWKSDGTTCAIDGSASTSGADLNLNTTTISSGVNVSISSWTITRGNA